MIAHFERVRKVMHDEAIAITEAAERLDPGAIHEAVELIYQCRGKIILLGVGKSGIVAQKIAATLTSTGTTAFFIHAADAAHGDLGSLRGEDLVVMLSNSGETDELTCLLPHLDRRSIDILAIVGNVESTLAQHAKVILNASVRREVCHLNLAPTSSTTVALAIGDALAMAVSDKKNLTTAEFALNHPSGRLGKRLTLRVRDVMHAGAELAVATPGENLREVVLKAVSHRLGAVNVVDDTGRLLGLITDGDIRRAFIKQTSIPPEQLVASEVMTANPITATPASLAYDALKLMNSSELGFAVLPIVDADMKAVGILRIQDLIKAGL